MSGKNLPSFKDTDTSLKTKKDDVCRSERNAMAYMNKKSSWHIFCMIGLRPFNLRVGCWKIKRNIPMFGKKGA